MRCRHFQLFCLMLLALSMPGCALGLMQAADTGDTSAVSSLLDRAINANTPFPILGSNALILAAAKGHTQVVGLLLDRGARINATDYTGWTPLHAAIYGGHAEVVRLLLERGAQLDQPDHWYLASPFRLAEALARDSGDRREVFTVIEAYKPQLAAKKFQR